MNNIRKFRLILVPILIATSFIGCGNTNEQKEVTVNIAETTVIEGETKDLNNAASENFNTSSLFSDTTASDNENAENQIIIEVNGKELIVEMSDNSSARALLEKLKDGDITIYAHDFSNFEKVGEIGFELPRNDEQITTEAGDVILYLGTRFVLYYDTNSWNFTRLGRVTNVPGAELKDILGNGDVTMILKLKK